MANNVAITAGSGTTVCTTDITSFSSYSTAGQIPAGVIYCSANTSTAPAPVTTANPLAVADASTTKLTITPGTALGSNTAAMVAGSVTTSAPSYTTGNINALSLDTSGNLRVATTNIGATGGTAPTTAARLGVTVGSTFQPLMGRTAIGGAMAQTSIESFAGYTGAQPVANSLPVAIATDQTAFPASLNTAAINDGATALTPKFAAIAASTSGNNTIVSAVSGKKIRVLGYRFSANGTVAAKWRSSTAGDISGLSYLVQYASAGAAFSPVGHFETAVGETLQLNLDGAVAVGGHVTYVEV